MAENDDFARAEEEPVKLSVAKKVHEEEKKKAKPVKRTELLKAVAGNEMHGFLLLEIKRVQKKDKSSEKPMGEVENRFMLLKPAKQKKAVAPAKTQPNALLAFIQQQGTDPMLPIPEKKKQNSSLQPELPTNATNYDIVNKPYLVSPLK